MLWVYHWLTKWRQLSLKSILNGGIWPSAVHPLTDIHNDCNHIVFSLFSSTVSHREIIFHLHQQRCMFRPSSWCLIIRAVLSFLLPRLRSSDRDVPPTEELHSEPWGWLLLGLCGRSWNRPRVSNGMTMKAPAGSHRILMHPLKPIVLQSYCSR